MGLSAPTARALSFSPQSALFDRVVGGGTEPAFAARILEERMRALRRKGLDAKRVTRDFLLALFAWQREGRIVRGAAEPLLAAGAKGEGDVARAVDALGLKPASAPEIAQAVAAAAAEGKGRTFPTEAAKARFLMGAAMRGLRGRAEGRDVLKALLARLA